MKTSFTPLGSILAATALLCASGAAQVTEFTARGPWEAAAGSFQTADFTGFVQGTIFTNQYQALGVLFTDGNDTSFHSPGAFLIDGQGVNCNGSMRVRFATPAQAIGVDFPGALKIDLYSGGALLYSSSNFAGSGAGFFAGLVSSQAFDEALLSDWVDGLAFIDNLSFSGGGLLLSVSNLAAGATATATVNGATPSSLVVLAYSLAGGGPLNVNAGGCGLVTVSLSLPLTQVNLTSNAGGTASLSANVPAGTTGVNVWAQAFDVAACQLTNAFAGTIS